MNPKDIENPIAETDFIWQCKKSKIDQKINAKGNCILLYYKYDDRIMRLIKSGYRHIEMYSPTILIPIQFTNHKQH